MDYRETAAWKRHKAAGGLDAYYEIWRVENPHSEGYRRWRITRQPFGEMLPGVYRTRAAAERHARKLGETKIE